MTDKEYDKQKARVQKLINRWFETMGLGWFHVDMVWNRERDYKVHTTAAKTTTSWQYRNAIIEWFLPSIADSDDDFLENIVIHEFVHILVAPLLMVDNEDDLPLQHEYVTECVARAIGWAREAGVKDAKKL
jgi:hypothetical protein